MALRGRDRIIEVEKEASLEEADRVRDAILAFMQGRDGPVATYLITLRRDERPPSRPVLAFVQNWNIETMGQTEHLKTFHVRNNREVGYLMTERFGDPLVRPRNVWVQGTCELIEDPESIADFFHRCKAVTGSGDPFEGSEYTRILMRTTPTLIRAEGFLGPFEPVIFRGIPGTTEE